MYFMLWPAPYRHSCDARIETSGASKHYMGLVIRQLLNFSYTSPWINSSLHYTEAVKHEYKFRTKKQL